MREQVITSPGSRNASRQGHQYVQRPARRGARAGDKRRFSIRILIRYAPAALRIVAGSLVVAALVIAYRAAASAALFQLRAVDIAGTSRTSAEEIESLARRAVARTGVWRADVPALSTELQRLPGVRRAVVTRVLPDRLRIRITERVPIAVVRTSAGHFIWVDDEGVSLGEMKATDQMPPFFIRGWSEDGTDVINTNSERVQKYLELVREWQAAGLAERVSEVNLIDLRDIRVQLAGDDSQIEVRLGSQEATQRLKSALDALDRYRQMTNGSVITYVDSQGPRVTLGFRSGNKIKASSDSTSPPQNAIAARVNPQLTRNARGLEESQNHNATARDKGPATSPKRNREASSDRKQVQQP